MCHAANPTHESYRCFYEYETTSSRRSSSNWHSEGLGVLLVEHDVEFVVRVCKRIHVLDFGQILAVGTPKQIQSSAAVQAAYLGGNHKQKKARR